MAPKSLARIAVAAILLAVGSIPAALAQSGTETTQNQGAQMPGMAMGGRMQGMVGGMPMGPLRGHMMKIMFAVADTDGDGGLSFEEVTAVHKRIFDSVDTNDDGKVTVEEMQTFMQGQ